MTCPRPDELLGYAAGELADVQPIAAHLDGCESCREAVAALLGSSLLGPEPEPVELQAGEEVGRYRVIGRVGAGGMGVVYAALDPELDRKVALKMLRGDLLHVDEAEERLRREARAMAKLSHPNLASALDIGRHRGRLFLAMEYVEGTLTSWLAERPRSWREVLAVLTQAGRGLAAAHALGVVHRDFKPDNILVSPDGRARVSDFGLATDVPRAAGGSAGQRNLTLTSSGQIVGTPLYMAPEQLAGEPADARADQFGFCVTLYQALWGEMPFDAGQPPSLRRLVDAVGAGRMRPPRAGPRWLHAVIARGLRPRAAARFPSMDTLLQALRPPRWRARIVAATGLLAIAAVAGVAFEQSRARRVLCTGQDLPLVVGERIAARYSAPEIGRAVAERLRAYAAEWTAARREACEATRLRGEQPAAVLDARMRCFDERALEMAALSRRFDDSAPPPSVATVAASLTPLSACAGGAVRLDDVPPTDPARRATWQELRQRIAELHVRYAGAQLAEAHRDGVALVADARAFGDHNILARALYMLGTVEAVQQQMPAADKTLEEAVGVADRARDDHVRAAALARLVWVRLHTGDDAGRDRALREARTVVERLRGDDAVEAQLESFQASIALDELRFSDAVANSERALAAAERAYGKDDARLLAFVVNLAVPLRKVGRLPDAGRAYERALALARRDLGPAHPQVGAVECNLSDLRDAEGRSADALVLLEHGLPLLANGFGPESREVMGALFTRARVLGNLDRSAEALSALDKAMAIGERVYVEKPRWVNERLSRAGFLRALGQRAKARAEIAALVPGTELEKARFLVERARQAADDSRLPAARQLVDESLRVVVEGFPETDPLERETLRATLLAEPDARIGAHKKVLEDRRSMPRPAFELGNRIAILEALIAMKRLDEARAELPAALAIDAGPPSRRAAAGLYAAFLGDTAAAPAAASLCGQIAADEAAAWSALDRLPRTAGTRALCRATRQNRK
jgi:tetratricopeptide (TPR) repeat protein